MTEPEIKAFLEYYRQRIRGPIPEWVRRLAIRLIRVVVPTVDKKSVEALLSTFFASDALGRSQSMPPEVSAAFLGHFGGLVLSIDAGSSDPKYSAMLDHARSTLRAALVDGLDRLLLLPHAQAVRASEAFTKALRSTVTDQGQFHGATSYWRTDLRILFFWPLIERMGSVAEVHRFLESEFGAQGAGELKRLEALFKAIGLRFRSRGRPPRKIRNLRKID